MLAALLFLTGLLVFRNDPPSETDLAATFSYWQDDRGRHQIVALLLTPLMGLLLIFYGAGLRRRLSFGSEDSGHGLVAFGGALLAAGTFLLVGMLEAAMTNAAKDGNRQAVYALNQLHSYDWLAWNAAFAALLSPPGSARSETRCCPSGSRGQPSSSGRACSPQQASSASSFCPCGSSSQDSG